MPWPLQVVAETAAYLSWASGVLTQAEQDEVVDILAANPTTGVLVQGTGGVRKFRYGPAGRGKSGGVRIVYYFHSGRLPIYILAGFAKNEKSTLTPTECRALRLLVNQLTIGLSR